MEEDKKCICCLKESDDHLRHVGLKFNELAGGKHPIETLLEYATRLALDDIVQRITKYKEQKTPVFIHDRCRSDLKNRSRKRKSDTLPEQVNAKSPSLRSKSGDFDFRKQCFYCGKVCTIDDKHLDRSNVQEVRTKDTKIYFKTLELCKSREDDIAKAIQKRLMGISDLVAEEAKYHTSCGSSFENPPATCEGKG